jgi:murein DD-endopeptidase MepM/ murein hydrolase activator NlpD
MGRLRPRALTLAVAASLAALLAGTAARAQVGSDPLPTLPTTTTTTTTTTAPPSSTTTTTTTAPPPSTRPTEPQPATTVPEPSSTTPTLQPTTTPTLPIGGGDSLEPGGGPVPPDAQSLTASIQRTPANNTRRLLAALQPLMDLGLSQGEAVHLGFGRFPVGGEATYSHDWWFPRHVPSFHLHEGTDIFAAEGTPVRAPADGTLKLVDSTIGGLAAYVYEANGSYHYLAHLSGFVPGQVDGQQVKLGETVGYVGHTGNAVGTPDHLHYEYHPAPTELVTTGKGKQKKTTAVQKSVPIGTQLPPVDPKPFLDQWLDEALAGVPKLVAAVEAGRPRAIIATGLTRRLADGRGGPFAAPSGPPRSQLLWASSASSGGVLRLAEAEATAAAGEVDYDALVREEQQRIREWEAADSWTRAMLTPLTPKGLRSVLGLSPGSSRTEWAARSPRP